MDSNNNWRPTEGVEQPMETADWRTQRKPNSRQKVVNKIEHEDLSVKAKSRFSISLRGLSQPMSLGEIARTWDICARAVISDYAQQCGGGSFSSKYGTWDNCLSTA